MTASSHRPSSAHRLSVRLWAIGTTRNEADIVEVMVRHHLAQGVERFLLLDNGSSDGTPDVLERLARECPLEWRSAPGAFRQDLQLTRLAREAFVRGAEWILPVDADEFWYAPAGKLTEALQDARASALKISVINFVQRRDQLVAVTTGMLTMTRRIEHPFGSNETVEGHVTSGRIAFVEHCYTPKWIARASADLEIGWGNHTLRGVNRVTGSPATDIVCLHAPLRARSILEQKLDWNRPATEVEAYLEQAWHIRRWRRIDREKGLDAEWRANSYDGECLDLNGERRQLVLDTQLRDLVAPWIASEIPASASLPTPVGTEIGGAAGVCDAAHDAIVARIRPIEGWLSDAEARLLIRTAARVAATFGESHPIVEIGSFHGKSTIALALAARPVQVFAIDPHEGTVGALDSDIGLGNLGSSLASFNRHIAEAGVESAVVPMLQHSFEVGWNRAISLLFIDGLHDTLSVRQDTEQFLDSVAIGGAVAFHDYASIFPGVQRYVDDLLAQGCLRTIETADSLIVLEKVAPTSTKPETNVAGAWRLHVAQLREGLAAQSAELQDARVQLSRSLQLMDRLSMRNDALATSYKAARELLEHSRAEIRRKQDHAHDLEDRLRAALTDHEQQMAAIQGQLQAATAAIRHHAADAAALRQSLTWRFSAPIRALVDGLLALKRTIAPRPNARDAQETSAPPRSLADPALTVTGPLTAVSRNESPPERGHRVLVVSDALPTPDRDSGSFRLQQLLGLLARQADLVTLIADQDAEGDEERVSTLRVSGIEVLCGRQSGLAHLETHGHLYSYVWLSRPDVAHAYLFAVRASAINAQVVYDTVDLHWLRMSRQYALTGDERAIRDAERYRKIESFNAESSDIVVAISEDERQQLLRHTKAPRVEVVPNIHPDVAHSAPWDNRTGLLFVGGFWHLPNVDAVTHFANDIFPIVRARLTSIVLTVVGSNMPDELRSLEGESIRCLGYVPDLSDCLTRTRISIAPLRYGAGMKGKIGQSMSYGVPVVTTSIGAEGLDLQDGQTALIADEPERFAEAIIRIYEDRALWERVSLSSREHIRSRCSPEVVGVRLARLFPPNPYSQHVARAALAAAQVATEPPGPIA